VSQQSSRWVGRVPGCGECGFGEGARHRRAISVSTRPDVSPGPVPPRPAPDWTFRDQVAAYSALPCGYPLRAQLIHIADHSDWGQSRTTRSMSICSSVGVPAGLASPRGRIDGADCIRGVGLGAAVRIDRYGGARSRMLVLTIVRFSGGNRPSRDIAVSATIGGNGRQTGHRVA
jgi:hypothetical protein